MTDNAIVYNIREPLWDGRSVGIANFRVRGDGTLYLTISHKNKDGNKTYPYVYKMDTKKVREYPTMTTNKGIVLHKVPIEDFEV
jgi:hypothetical protein